MCTVNHEKSHPVLLSYGVPQRSVGGPFPFALYLNGLEHVLQCHIINYHRYADDVQLYVSFIPEQNYHIFWCINHTFF